MSTIRFPIIYEKFLKHDTCSQQIGWQYLNGRVLTILQRRALVLSTHAHVQDNKVINAEPSSPVVHSRDCAKYAHTFNYL